MTEQQSTEAEPTDEPGDREAARYRRRLRDVETERDTLAGQLHALRRAELERIATSGDGPRLHDVADVWPDEATDVTELLDEHGRVDPDAVRGVIERATAGRSHLRADLARPVRRGDPSQGAGSDAPGESPSWASVIRGDDR